ncbi:hypothetical protein EYB26_007695 [Talaromyces marneffei]|uniref:uncharacterized protein n=1 Tax=Talaromyces marneffei TaxID=37727 RepID=UPI0012A87E10|nr:uncharacterized protein EYB26_007695 [Talaromyces marneffei]QGA19995.1 hypothetical protein EYB26_007695 [Talaromyces marneffei]
MDTQRWELDGRIVVAGLRFVGYLSLLSMNVWITMRSQMSMPRDSRIVMREYQASRSALLLTTQAITKGILISPTPLLGTVVGEVVALVLEAAEVVLAAEVVVAEVVEGTAEVEEEVTIVVEEEKELEDVVVDEELVDEDEEADVEVADALVVDVEPVTPVIAKRGE